MKDLKPSTRQYGEDAISGYALADTARALGEARHRGVRPYLITVDPAGGGYLSRMCDPREYHVIADARDLPGSLAQLYVVARASSRPERRCRRSSATQRHRMPRRQRAGGVP